MPKIKYADLKLGKDKLAKIAQANEIIAEYSKGLTLRQLYYRLVTKNLIANNNRQYKMLGDAVADGRMAGLIDWEAIIDRTRFVRDHAHWDSPAEIVAAVARQFRLDKWARQRKYVEVVIEKDALIGVIEDVCRESTCRTWLPAATRRRRRCGGVATATRPATPRARSASFCTWATTTPRAWT